MDADAFDQTPPYIDVQVQEARGGPGRGFGEAYVVDLEGPERETWIRRIREQCVEVLESLTGSEWQAVDEVTETVDPDSEESGETWEDVVTDELLFPISFTAQPPTTRGYYKERLEETRRNLYQLQRLSLILLAAFPDNVTDKSIDADFATFNSELVQPIRLRPFDLAFYWGILSGSIKDPEQRFQALLLELMV